MDSQTYRYTKIHMYSYVYLYIYIYIGIYGYSYVYLKAYLLKYSLIPYTGVIHGLMLF
jgi:hypothetical protein